MGTVSVLPVVNHRAFWGEMAPCEHVVQIYGDGQAFLDALCGYIASGLRRGEAAIVIATATHLHGIERWLRGQGLDLEAARLENRYIARLAEDVLGEFMVKGWPDEGLFHRAIGELLAQAQGDSGRRVRVFGEMVATLWGRGAYAATIQLELLWSRLIETRRFALFCAYPKASFPRNSTESIVDICRMHSKVLPVPEVPET